MFSVGSQIRVAFNKYVVRCLSEVCKLGEPTGSDRVVTKRNVSVTTDGSGLLLGRSGVKNCTKITPTGPSGRLGGSGSR